MVKQASGKQATGSHHADGQHCRQAGRQDKASVNQLVKTDGDIILITQKWAL
jgi:hypothetical protein